MIGIYHSRDLDGFTSGAIIKRRYPDAKLIGYDYGQPFNIDSLMGESVIMADVSMPMMVMFTIAEIAKDFTWIDHHISAIKDYNLMAAGGDVPAFTAVLEDGISACEGTWKHLFPGEDIPEAIKLLGEYDTWRNQDKEHWDKFVMPFQFGMRMVCNSPGTFPWNAITPDGIEHILDKGDTVLAYQRQINETACKSAAFEFTFEGLRAICLNGGGFNSDTFRSVYDESKHDLMMPFRYNGKGRWMFSLYTTHPHIDCSELAKKYGGGGHRKAAGFDVPTFDLIFNQTA